MPVDLLKSARCCAEHLGLPMPDDRHAVSACLPLWAHNIGYEESDPMVMNALQAAYPRFCLHPLIKQLCSRFLDGTNSTGLPFASRNAAIRAIDYVTFHGVKQASIVEFPDQSVCGVSVQPADFATLKQYWQHAGENVSSRMAEQILDGKTATSCETSSRTAVRSTVANLHGTSEQNVFLFPSGMAAIACTWRTVTEFRTGSTVQFGFPYVDTLKIQQRFPASQHSFFPVGTDEDIGRLRQLCEASPPVAVFCEVPANPLLVTPDVRQLRELADKFGFLLIIDDTLGACCNLNVLPFADLVVTSLTKFFSGYGNVLAGSLVANPQGQHANRLRDLVSANFEELLADCDVEVLHHNSQDLEQRIRTINKNAGRLVRFLSEHPAVDSVCYPDEASPNYQLVARPGGGGGGLFSIVLKNAAAVTPTVFDRLEVCKGPNLGTNFTLCCPYTILAHYTELEFAEDCGVSRWLLRVSVGTEPYDDLQQRFESALATAETSQ